MLNIISSEQDIEHSENLPFRVKDNFYKKLLNLFSCHIAVLKKENMECILVNENLAKILEYKKEELTGKTPLELNLWKEDVDKLVRGLKNNKSMDDFFVEFTTKHSKKIYGNVYAQVLEIDNEEIILAFVKNFSNLKSDVGFLRSDEKRFNRLLEVMPDILFRLNKKLVFIDCYTNSPDNLIVPPNEIIGSHARHILPKELYNLTAEKLKYTLENKSASTYEFNVHLYEDEKWFEARMIPYSDSEVLIILRNVTESKKAKIELYKSEQKFKNLTENLLGVTYIGNNDEKYTMKFLTKNVVKLCGFTAEEFLSEKTFYADLIHPCDYNYVRNEINRAEKNLASFKIRYRIFTSKGKLKWIDESGLVVKNSDGTKHIEGYIMDISGYIEKENELKKYRIKLEKLVEKRTRELDQINSELREEIEKTKNTELQLKKSLVKEKEYSELKSRFISTASHEFRTPLTTILSSVDLIDLFINTEKHDEIFPFIEKVRDSVSSLTSLIDDILVLNKTDRKIIVNKPVSVNVKELVNKIINEILFSSNNNISVIFNSNISDNKKYLIDEKQFSMVCVNLISNSFKYSDNNGKVSVKLKYKNKKLIFTVKDNGIGIEENDLPYIFEQFHRGKNTGNIQGTGLGLSIVKKSVELLQGSIEVKSSKNYGSRFKVKIPVKRSRDA